MGGDPVSSLCDLAMPGNVPSGSGAGPDRSANAWGVAYLSDPIAVNGAGILFSQKRWIDSYAARHGIIVRGYVVDAGRPNGRVPLAHALSRLMIGVRDGALPIVLVEHVSRFAEDYAVALRIAAALSSLGAEVHELRGGRAILDSSVAAPLLDVPVDPHRQRASSRIVPAAAWRVANRAIGDCGC